MEEKNNGFGVVAAIVVAVFDLNSDRTNGNAMAFAIRYGKIASVDWHSNLDGWRKIKHHQCAVYSTNKYYNNSTLIVLIFRTIGLNVV